MALTNLNGLYVLGSEHHLQGTSALIDAANEVCAGVFYPSRAGDITEIALRVDALTTSKSLRIGVQTVDATTGLHTGTWLGSGAAYYDLAAPAAATDYVVTLGAPATVALGTPYAVVAKWTDDGDPGNLSIVTAVTRGNAFHSANNTLQTNTFYLIGPGASTKVTTASPCFGLGYSGVYYPHPMPPPIASSGHTAVSLDADGTIRSAGNRFLLPYGARAVGIAWHGDLDQNGAVDLLADDGSSLATASFDSDIRGGTAGAAGLLLFGTPYTLVANTWYRAAVRASATTAANLAYYVGFASNAQLGQLSPGSSCYYTTSNGSTWTNVTTQRASLSVVIDQIETGAAGGLLVVPGMSGGMRG